MHSMSAWEDRTMCHSPPLNPDILTQGSGLPAHLWVEHSIGLNLNGDSILHDAVHVVVFL